MCWERDFDLVWAQIKDEVSEGDLRIFWRISSISLAPQIGKIVFSSPISVSLSDDAAVQTLTPTFAIAAQELARFAIVDWEGRFLRTRVKVASFIFICHLCLFHLQFFLNLIWIFLLVIQQDSCDSLDKITKLFFFFVHLIRIKIFFSLLMEGWVEI